MGFAKYAALRSNVILQPHQEDFRNRSRHAHGGMIANWQVGAGKSPGTLAVTEDRGGRVLAIVPAALRENYRSAIKQFVTDDRHGDYDVAGHEEFTKNPEKFLSKNPRSVVVDEMHRARNPIGLRKGLEAHRHRMPFMIGATGSLVNNHPSEIVPLVNLVAGRKVFDSEAEFTRRHIGTEKIKTKGFAGLFRKTIGEREVIKNQKELAGRLGPHVHRFHAGMDANFASNFPTVTSETIKVEMTPRQHKLYNAILNSNPGLARKIRNNLPPTKTDLKNMNAFSVGLRQISNSPASFDASIKDPVEHSPKLQRMMHEQKIRAKNDPNFRAVVYSSFLDSGVKPVVDALSAKGVKGQTFTGGMTDKQRAATVADYNSGRKPVLGISPAGGEGLDLKGTRLIQLTEGHWNPEREVQVTGRGARFKSHAHLPADKRTVHVQRLQAVAPRRWWHKGNLIKPDTTVDEWIDERRQEKARLNQQFLDALHQKN